MSEFHDAVTELIIMAGRVSIDLPVFRAEELSLAISRATNALQAAAQPPAPITAEDVRAAERAWNARHLTHNKDKPAFVADYLNRRGERA